MTMLRRFALVAAGIALCSTAYVAGRHAANAQTQPEMNESTYHDFQKSDKQLNVLYQQLIQGYDKKDPYAGKTRKKFVLAERAWIAFRDTEADAEASWQAEGGTMYPMSYNIAAKQITDARIKKLKVLLEGPYPGA